MRSRFCLLGLVLLGAVPACSNPGVTSMLIDVESTLAVPTDLDGLEIAVVGAESGGMIDQNFALATPFPATFRVYPHAGHETEAVTITVTGTRTGMRRVRRVVGAAFVQGTEITVRIDLEASCVSVICPDGVDCAAGHCHVTADAGIDAGDVGPSDARIDAACATDCNDHFDCTTDRCNMGTCQHTPDDTLCTAGQICDPLRGCATHCATDADCDDHLYCNGTEVCTMATGHCASGTPIPCDDAVSCTTDTCNDTTHACVHTADDMLCGDGNSCNGLELCDATTGCHPGAALNCDDSAACSVDGCASNMCTHRTVDVDMDGHGDSNCPAYDGTVPNDDCNDTNVDVFTGAPEICNGLDDNCDGTADETFTCARGAMGTCPTSCGSTGSRTCSGSCSWSVCVTPPELCNGLDDDCNGSADDTFACVANTTTSCRASCGTTGTSMCGADCSVGACVPPAEICGDGIDQDCDGIDPICRTCPLGTDAECDDGLFCNGPETCFRNLCLAGVPIVCNDGVRCTTDTCTEALRACTFVPSDAICQDGNFCNGAETCDAVTGCLAGSAPSCDDGNACHTGVCNGTAPGMCVQTTHDGDGDGHGVSTCPAIGGVPADDCNDAVATTYTGAPEFCNGTDDNCDGTCDNGFACCQGSTGMCTTTCGTMGSRVCSSVCSWSLCSPPAEVCNGIDDDCNGAADDGFACIAGGSGSCMTSCGSTGMRTCSGSCAWGMCTPPVETCNGLDDDCDGMIDNGFACVSGSSGSCTTTCGTTGTHACTAGVCTYAACVPPTESCNGIDDNCNGQIDETSTCTPGVMGSCTTSCGSTGSETCTALCNFGTCNPPAEVCNGLDDDCNGVRDNGFTCIAGASGSCTSACGSTGSRTCSGTCAWGSCSPPAEICNGLDDDCNGVPDNGFTCAAGSSGSCTTPCGSTGTRTCSAACTWGACMPPAEICNGLDDDCDGAIDSPGFTCARGSTGSCVDSCGTTGTRTCSATCAWGSCTPPAETCNGLDDDCVSGCDNGFACCQGSVGSCTTGCGSTGSRSCSGSCSWGSCNPPGEVCNGMDDDCVGGCDNGFACCASTSGSCTTSCGSTGTQLCSGTCTLGACTPPSEICNGLDDDCVSGCDNGFTCCRGGTSSCTTSCGSTGTQVCNATCTGYGSCTPPAENCTNTVDDDCDGAIDGADTDCASICPGSTHITAPGGRYTHALVPHVYSGTCGGAGAEAYFDFTLSVTQDVFLTTHGSLPLNTVLYVRSLPCATGAQVGCNTDADGQVTSSLHLTNLNPGTYLVFVDTVSGVSSGTAVLDAYITAPATPSDLCGNPTLIPPGTTTISGTTCGFNSDYLPVFDATNCVSNGSTCIAGGATERVYYFYVPTTRTVTFTGCGSGMNSDQTLFIRSVCTDTSAGAQLACVDDSCSGSPSCVSGHWNSNVSVTLGPGLYYLFSDSAACGCPCGVFQYAITGI